MSYNEEYAKQGLHPMCPEPLRYGRMFNMDELNTKNTAEKNLRLKECKEPFKVCIKNAKPEPSMSPRTKRMLRLQPKFHIHVESDDPCLLLRVCHDIMTALEDCFASRPEVAFGDVSFVQKTIDEGAEPEKDA